MLFYGEDAEEFAKVSGGCTEKSDKLEDYLENITPPKQIQKPAVVVLCYNSFNTTLAPAASSKGIQRPTRFPKNAFRAPENPVIPECMMRPKKKIGHHGNCRFEYEETVKYYTNEGVSIVAESKEGEELWGKTYTKLDTELKSLRLFAEK